MLRRKIVKKIIFENLPTGIMEELERPHPPNAKWQRMSRMNQRLTRGIGHPQVDKLVSVSTVLFHNSGNDDEFWRAYAKALPKSGDQLEPDIRDENS